MKTEVDGNQEGHRRKKRKKKKKKKETSKNLFNISVSSERVTKEEVGETTKMSVCDM